MNVASIQGAHTGHLEVLYNAIDKWGQFWLYFWFFLLVQMHVKEYLVKEESSLWDSSLILYHWAEEDSIMSHIHSSILFTYLTLSTLLILSAYRPLVKDSKDIKSSGKDIKKCHNIIEFLIPGFPNWFTHLRLSVHLPGHHVRKCLVTRWKLKIFAENIQTSRISWNLIK